MLTFIREFFKNSSCDDNSQFSSLDKFYQDYLDVNLLELLFSVDHILIKRRDKEKVLLLYKKILELTDEAYDAFLDGDLKKFDAHVGDTACQIRAYEVFCLYQNSRILKKKLIKQKRKLIKLIRMAKSVIDESLEVSSNTRDPIKVYDYIFGLNLSFILSKQEVFLLQTYFLAKITVIDDEYRISSWIDFSDFKKAAPYIARNFFNKMVSSFQKDLAKNSVLFISSLLSDLCECEVSDDIDMFVRYDEVGRPILPTFITSMAIFCHLLKFQCNVLLVGCIHKGISIKRVLLSFKPNKRRDGFKLTPYVRRSLSYFVVKGEACRIDDRKQLIQLFKDEDLLTFLMATMAWHPQYAWKGALNEQDIFLELSENYKGRCEFLRKACSLYATMKNMGKQLFENNTPAFLARHIFSGKYSDID